MAVLICYAAFSFYSRRGGGEDNTIRAVHSNEPISFTRISDGRDVGGAVISPDEKFVAYFQNDNVVGGGTLFLRQLETNREMHLLKPDERTFGNIDFSPDGSLIYYTSFKKNAKIGSLYRISILGGTPRLLFNLEAGSAFFSVSPNGKQIAFYRTDAETQPTTLFVSALDGTSGGEKVLHSHPREKVKRLQEEVAEINESRKAEKISLFRYSAKLLNAAF